MAFNIEISDTARFTVKFTSKDEKGVEKTSSFDLTAERLDVEAFKTTLEAVGGVYADFMAAVVKDWEGVRDGSGTPVEYSEAALRSICKIAGLSSLMFKAYCAETAVKEKN